MNTPTRTLSDEELEAVAAGATDEAILKCIETSRTRVPQNVRETIIDAYTKYGKKAAKAVTLKLATGNLAYMKTLAKYLTDAQNGVTI